MKTMREATQAIPTIIGARDVIIQHSGHDFVASKDMAEIFRRRSREVLASGHAELVPLLHSEGIELLLVGLVRERIPV